MCASPHVVTQLHSHHRWPGGSTSRHLRDEASFANLMEATSLEWLLDRQDVLRHRAGDLKILGSEEEYQKVMIFFCGVIQAFGKAVEVRQQVIATAIVYFRRFYSRSGAFAT
ncbi:hypothetical protein SprV_0301070800 [Sparganum proliferum]